jgi:hypothetical protein
MIQVRNVIRGFLIQLSDGLKKLAGPDTSSPRENSERLQALRRPHFGNWEILPRSSECDLPFRTELGAFPEETPGRTTEQSADRIRISVNRWRLR